MTLPIEQSLQMLGRMQLPLGEFVSGRLGYPHEAFLAFDYEISRDLPPEGDVVVLAGRYNRRQVIEDLGRHAGRVVVVFAPGDAPLRRRYLGGATHLPDNVVVAYATSNLLDDRRVTSVPLGIRPSNLPAARFVRRALVDEPRRLALANFTANTTHYRDDPSGRPHIRQRVLEQHADSPWLDVDVAAEQRPGQDALHAYYAQLARHRFVLSPEGNGIDCYRHWEALFFGAVPIVQRSRAMAPFADLPMLFTDDYSELSAEYLEARWEELSARTFDVSALLQSTYRQHFLRSVGTLHDPRFVLLDRPDDWGDRLLRTLNRPPRPFGVEIAVPQPPYVRPRALLAPESWRLGDGLQATAGADGMAFTNPADRRGTAALRLNVVQGAVFAVRGTASPGGGPLTVRVTDRRGAVQAADELVVGDAVPFALEFLAPGPAELQLVPAAGHGATLHDLEVRAVL